MAEKGQPKRTEIAELGEFGLIDHLTKNIVLKNKTSIKGVGDDAAIIGCKEGEVKVTTTDMLVEGIHFDLSYHPLQHLGYKAVIANLSDVYAMNARPEQILVSIALSNRFSVEATEMLYEGMLAACNNYDVDMVGGDTCASRKGLIISITAIGTAERQAIATRDGANIGDLIAVSGDLGGAYFGLQMLEREKQVYMDNPDINPTWSKKNTLCEGSCCLKPAKTCSRFSMS
jgi:thiamine-monophosphate kinase